MFLLHEELVLVVVDRRVLRARAVRTVPAGLHPVWTDMNGFWVEADLYREFAFADLAAREHGVAWCRGWTGEDADALRALAAMEATPS